MMSSRFLVEERLKLVEVPSSYRGLRVARCVPGGMHTYLPKKHIHQERMENWNLTIETRMRRTGVARNSAKAFAFSASLRIPIS